MNREREQWEENEAGNGLGGKGVAKGVQYTQQALVYHYPHSRVVPKVLGVVPRVLRVVPRVVGVAPRVLGVVPPGC